MTRIARLSISNIDFLRKSSMVAVWFLATALFTFAFLCQPPAQAQTTSATLTATVFDASGAVVPDATVTLKNEASGDLRTTKSNAEGYFTFAAVPPATYTNAVEFIKIMPGMAFTGSVSNQSSYAAQDERTDTGPVGSFSANGTRTGALDITSDGAHIIDPGCNCGQAMNTNADMTAELRVMTSNFGA